MSVRSTASATQFETNVVDLNKASRAIRDHDRALQIVLEQVSEFHSHLGALVDQQAGFTKNLEQVLDVQRRMTQTEAGLSKSLASLSNMAETQVPEATQRLEKAATGAGGELRAVASVLEQALASARTVTSQLAGVEVSKLGDTLTVALTDALRGMDEALAAGLARAQVAFDDATEQRLLEVRRLLDNHLRTVTSTARGVAGLAERMDAAHQNLERQLNQIDTQMQRMEARMEVFQQQIMRANEVLASRVAEKEAQIEAEKATLGKTLQRVRSLFGRDDHL